MSDLQRYPLNLYLVNIVEYIVVFIAWEVFNSVQVTLVEKPELETFNLEIWKISTPNIMDVSSILIRKAYLRVPLWIGHGPLVITSAVPLILKRLLLEVT